MSQVEFNHLIESLSALSPEQLHQLRRQLDGQLAMTARPANAAAFSGAEAEQERSPEENGRHDATGDPAAPAGRKPLWQRAAELRESVPAEEWGRLPADGAAPESGGEARSHELTAEEREEQALQRRLVEFGLLSEVKPPIRDLEAYRGRRAVSIQGEPLSETVIRERR